jgi:hypothetical protein
MKYEPWLDDDQKEYYLSHEKSCVWFMNSFIDNTTSHFKDYHLFFCRKNIFSEKGYVDGLYSSMDGYLERNYKCEFFIECPFEIKIIKK